MRLRSCSRCGRIHSDKYVCPSNIRRKYTNTEENELRSRYSWKLKRESIRERSFYLCAICKSSGDYRAKDIEIHHIRKLKDYPQGLLEDSNLIALCIEHHKAADKGEIDPDYLRKLADIRDGILEE